MLVLSRKQNEKICIGNDILIAVVEIRGDKVRIGIQAPDDMQVDRAEVRAAKDFDGRRNPPRGLMSRQALMVASKEAEDLLAKVAFGEYVDPATIQSVIDRLKKASGEISAMEWENQRKRRMHANRQEVD